MEDLPCFSFDRNSSMPLEHKFGYARMKAHDVHTLKRFLRTVSTLQADQQYQFITQAKDTDEKSNDIVIRKRRSAVGAYVESKEVNQKVYCVFYDENEHKYTPQQVARSILIAAGFQLDQNDEIIDIHDVLSWTFFLITEFCDDKQIIRKRQNRIALSEKRLGVGQCSNGKRLITGSVPTITQLTSKEDKYEFAHNLVFELCGKEPTKEDLRSIIAEIVKFDPSATPPGKSENKSTLQKWIYENIHIYYILLEELRDSKS